MKHEYHFNATRVYKIEIENGSENKPSQVKVQIIQTSTPLPLTQDRPSKQDSELTAKLIGCLHQHQRGNSFQQYSVR